MAHRWKCATEDLLFVKTPKLGHICQMYALLLIPFLAFVVIFAAGKRANAWAGWLAMAATLAGLVFSMGLYTEFDGQPTGETFTWLNIQNTAFNFTFQLDKLAFLMLFVVHLVALLVQVFSMNYMAHDAYRWRYFAFLQLFIFSMLGVVLAADLLLMYVFWELVGLSSYLLIGFWYAKPRAAWAAQKAFLLNRVGDAGFLMGILLLLANGQSTHFESLSIGLPLPSTAVGLLLFCGVVGKSAQWPLSTWLPDAMEGPTPVSALIHAATMVAAGIFLLARIHFLLTPQALLVVAGIGTITMLLGAYQAVFQNDIKKMLAYSTVSQLGLMVLAMGIGAREASLFHLLTHAFFKAGLFLSAGAIIHHLHTQDVRQMGGLRTKLPVVFVAYTTCAAALAGVPFFSGFLSKDSILLEATAWASARGGMAYVVPVLALLSAAITAFYVARQWRLIFLETFRGADMPQKLSIPSDWFTNIPLIVLAALSVFGWISVNPFDAADSWFFQLFPTLGHSVSHLLVVGASVLATFTGLVLGYQTAHRTFTPYLFEIKWLNEFSEQQPSAFLIPIFQKMARSLAYFDRWVLDVTVNGIGYVSVIGAHVLARFEHLLIDGSINALAWTVRQVGNRARNLQNGQIQSYFVVMLVGVILMIFWFLG